MEDQIRKEHIAFYSKDHQEDILYVRFCESKAKHPWLESAHSKVVQSRKGKARPPTELDHIRGNRCNGLGNEISASKV